MRAPSALQSTYLGVAQGSRRAMEPISMSRGMPGAADAFLGMGATMAS